MESKYYTPDESDFVVGMNYEINEDERIGDWAKYSIDDLNDLHNTTKYHTKYIGKYAEIRVKYLDREDIESLGWIQVDLDLFDYTLPNDKKIYLEFNMEQKVIIYKTIDRVIFNGEIKNKSDLIRIMQMVGINQ